MDIRQWQQRLESLATAPDLRDSLSELKEAERRHEDEILRRLSGYRAIIEGFEAFAASTFSVLENHLRVSPPQYPRNYTVLLLRIVACLRSFRAATNTFLLGYPMPGLAILRTIKDWSLMIAAVGNGVTTLTGINGLEEQADTLTSLPPDMDVVRQRRMREERRVLKAMLWDPMSGLDKSVQKELQLMTDLFNMEVHAAIGSAVFDMDLKTGSVVAPLLHPRFSEQPVLAFTNRACEVGWMILRIVPLLQVSPRQFDVAWAQRWKVLDASFRFLASNLAAEGKPIGAAIIQLMDRRLDFTPERTCYTESMA